MVILSFISSPLLVDLVTCINGLFVFLSIVQRAVISRNYYDYEIQMILSSDMNIKVGNSTCFIFFFLQFFIVESGVEHNKTNQQPINSSINRIYIALFS